MVESASSASNDDPFERAARKERLAHYMGYGDDDYTMAPGMLGLTATWAVVLALHAWLAGSTSGFFFRSHLIVFALWSAITAGVLVHAIAARFLHRP
jgi:hypothetical protein